MVDWDSGAVVDTRIGVVHIVAGSQGGSSSKFKTAFFGQDSWTARKLAGVVHSSVVRQLYSCTAVAQNHGGTLGSILGALLEGQF